MVHDYHLHDKEATPDSETEASLDYKARPGVSMIQKKKNN